MQENMIVNNLEFYSVLYSSLYSLYNFIQKIKKTERIFAQKLLVNFTINYKETELNMQFGSTMIEI